MFLNFQVTSMQPTLKMGSLVILCAASQLKRFTPYTLSYSRPPTRSVLEITKS